MSSLHVAGERRGGGNGPHHHTRAHAGDCLHALLALRILVLEFRERLGGGRRRGVRKGEAAPGGGFGGSSTGALGAPSLS